MFFHKGLIVKCTIIDPARNQLNLFIGKMSHQGHALIASPNLYVLCVLLKERKYRPVPRWSIITIMASGDSAFRIDYRLDRSSEAYTGNASGDHKIRPLRT